MFRRQPDRSTVVAVSVSFATCIGLATANDNDDREKLNDTTHWNRYNFDMKQARPSITLSTTYCDNSSTPPIPPQSVYSNDESMQSPPSSSTSNTNVTVPSWWRQKILAPIGIPLPLPRVLTPRDPALKLP